MTTHKSNKIQIKKQQLSSHQLPDTILFRISFLLHKCALCQKKKRKGKNTVNTRWLLDARATLKYQQVITLQKHSSRNVISKHCEEFICPSANPFPPKLTQEIPAKATFAETRHVAFKQTGWSWEQSKNKASSISGALSFSTETLCQIVSCPTLFTLPTI
ncbi:hypothetical protein CDAR_577711 [Caerostris darwini]|uniref:Uncharacterized protein n=1 Tax=Caerostris darwini TaxID=1538125 RepID=A0AAV4REZ2_9ARAC|nr:hypothetical protein CDAR_577711 [Caerostris darwini]